MAAKTRGNVFCFCGEPLYTYSKGRYAGCYFCRKHGQQRDFIKSEGGHVRGVFEYAGLKHGYRNLCADCYAKRRRWYWRLWYWLNALIKSGGKTW